MPVIVQPTLLIIILPRKPQVDHRINPIPIRVLLRQAVGEGIAWGVAPDDGALGVGGKNRRALRVGVDEVEVFGGAAAGDDGDELVVGPDVFAQNLSLGGGFKEQVALRVVVVDGGLAADGFAGTQAAVVVGVVGACAGVVSDGGELAVGVVAVLAVAVVDEGAARVEGMGGIEGFEPIAVGAVGVGLGAGL